MQTGALIAAAGSHDAMDGRRPLLRMNGTTLIQKEIDILRQADISPIVVVTGDGAEELEHHLAHRGVICLRNEDYASTQMLDSVKMGLRYLRSRCRRILFLPVHAPLFSVESVKRVMEEDASVVFPCHNGVCGHPILIGTEVIPHVLAYKGEEGLRGALRAWEGSSSDVEVDDPGILIQIGNEEQYREALQYEQAALKKKGISQRVRLTLGREEDFFGPGIADLLERIESEGSLLSACKSMRMSYSKGWKMLKALEEGTGFSFLTRRAGGADGGNSELTPRGADFLRRYRAMEAYVQEAAEKAFGIWFPEQEEEQ